MRVGAEPQGPARMQHAGLIPKAQRATRSRINAGAGRSPMSNDEFLVSALAIGYSLPVPSSIAVNSASRQ